VVFPKIYRKNRKEKGNEEATPQIHTPQQMPNNQPINNINNNYKNNQNNNNNKQPNNQPKPNQTEIQQICGYIYHAQTVCHLLLSHFS